MMSGWGAVAHLQGRGWCFRNGPSSSWSTQFLSIWVLHFGSIYRNFTGTIPAGSNICTLGIYGENPQSCCDILRGSQLENVGTIYVHTSVHAYKRYVRTHACIHVCMYIYIYIYLYYIIYKWGKTRNYDPPTEIYGLDGESNMAGRRISVEVS